MLLTTTSSTISIVCQEYQKAPVSWGGLVYVTLKLAGMLGVLGLLLMAAYLRCTMKC
jgi:hypothetical protein